MVRLGFQAFNNLLCTGTADLNADYQKTDILYGLPKDRYPQTALVGGARKLRMEVRKKS